MIDIIYIRIILTVNVDDNTYSEFNSFYLLKINIVCKLMTPSGGQDDLTGLK